MRVGYGLVALLVCAVMEMGTADVSAAEQQMYGRRNPFAMERLPAGRLRRSLEDLSPVARERALRWLHNFDFPASDTINSLRVDPQGSVLYVDPAPTGGAEGAGTVAAAGAATPVAITTADAFKLQSKPGAPRTLYLDFNGHVITGTVWNSVYGKNQPYDALPYSIDTNYDAFSATELQNIINIWRRVAEDFAPFNVNVTTQEPASFTANVGRAVITRDSDRNGRAMPLQGAGGVAYVGVFGYEYYGYYSPALVYSNRLGGGREDYVAEATSHELGHNLGLSHDATAGTSYYTGHGTGSATSWGPIMGVSYNKMISQWSIGEYAGANNREDDTAVLAGRLGVRPDDHPNTNTGATPLITSAGGIVASTTVERDIGNVRPENKGIIGSRSDVDVFTFNAGAGPLNLTIAPNRMPANTAGGNLDLQVELYAEGGARIATVAPDGNATAILSRTVSQGRYYLHVSGVGDAVTPYSDYGSLGQYYISGSIPVATINTVPPAPNPMTFEIAPRSTVAGSVTMRAAVATDDAGSAVQYQFLCISGGTGCANTGWVVTRDLTVTGLTPGAAYSYSVKARDAFGNETSPSNAASVTVLAPVVTPNLAPRAVTDVYSVKRLTTVTLSVLANDTDRDGDRLTIVGLSGPVSRRGTATMAPGHITYAATASLGRHQFSYQITDGRGGNARGSVVLNVVP